MEPLPAGRTLPALVACVALALVGCASTAERTPTDPIEPFNRGVHKFNDSLDRAVLRPTAQAYVKVMPEWFRTGVGNFYTNLKGPGTILNQLLQGKFREAGQDTGRFLLNLTFGLGGVIDVATMNELPQHDEDFGQTLGTWGVPPGPYLVLPFLGPSTVRDGPSKIVDGFLEPLYWYPNDEARWGSLVLSFIDDRARLLPLDATLAETYDPYAFIRDAFLQRRQYLVYDGNPPEEPIEEFDDFEDETGEPIGESGGDAATDQPAAEGPTPADEAPVDGAPVEDKVPAGSEPSTEPESPGTERSAEPESPGNESGG
jgi:phospholipid-binding lipoprotein MlaA